MTSKTLKRRTAPQMLSPDEAGTFEAICSLQTDGDNVPSGWIALDGGLVVLHNQKPGKPSTGSVRFTKREFAQLARWYFRPQRTRKEP